MQECIIPYLNAFILNFLSQVSRHVSVPFKLCYIPLKIAILLVDIFSGVIHFLPQLSRTYDIKLTGQDFLTLGATLFRAGGSTKNLVGAVFKHCMATLRNW